MPMVAMPNNLDAIRRSGVGRFRPGGVDDEEDLVEDFEDSTRVRRPSDAGAIAMSDEVVSRFRDILIVKLTARKVSLRNLAKILNVSHETVRTRLKSIPPHTRRYYEKVELE